MLVIALPHYVALLPAVLMLGSRIVLSTTVFSLSRWDSHVQTEIARMRLLSKDRGNLMKDRPNLSRCGHCFLVLDDYTLLNVVCCAK